MTNLDKVRKMSAEELAEKLKDKGKCAFCIWDDCTCGGIVCKSGMTSWLNQEVNPLPSLEIADVVETFNYSRYVVIGEDTVIGVKGIHSTTIPAYIWSVGDVLAHESIKYLWRYNLAKKIFEKIWEADDEPNDKCSINIVTRNLNHCKVDITEGLNQDDNPMPEIKIGDVISLLVDSRTRDYVILSDKYAYGLLGGYLAEWKIVSKEIKRIKRINNNTGELEDIWRADNDT